jgi:HK97 gp10 family phage protein
MSSAIDGLPKLFKQLRNLAQLDQGKALRRGVKAGMRPAQQRARAAIPVGVDKHRTYKGREVAPGFARKSIRVVVSVSRDKKRAEAILGVRAEAFYATQFVELGTSRTPAQPWLRPAFKSSSDQQQTELATELRAAIEQLARST